MDGETEVKDFSNLTNIQSFFYGQSVFLTGVTGLLGKVVLEKILRCCPGIGMIYIHIRPKKGSTPQERMEKLFNLELFQEVKKVFPSFRSRVQVVEGDLTKPKLGLSVEDFQNICQNVSIVIHSAANVNFKSPIKIAVENNMISVLKILDLCHAMPHIKVLIHVSTSYVRREEDGSVLEEIPKCKVDPEKLIDALEWLDEECQSAIEKYLLDKNIGQITTYNITKALAEVLLEAKRGNLPLAIVRPGYISSTWKEPFPGWIDGVQGLSGLALASAKGVLRTLYIVKGVRINMIPADIVTNTILAAAWHVGSTKPVNIFIVNCTMDYNSLPPAEETMIKFVMENHIKYPLSKFFRYPNTTYYYNKLTYQVHSLIDQWIPALIIDSLLWTFTGKTILIKIYNKITYSYDVMFKFSKDPWLYRLDNYNALEHSLSEKDKKIFFMNVDNFDWHDYSENTYKGGRKFVALEDPSNIDYARKRAKIWWTVTTILKWFIILYFSHYLMSSSFIRPLYKYFERKLHSIYF